jgi:C1A family cysteine protease
VPRYRMPRTYNLGNDKGAVTRPMLPLPLRAAAAPTAGGAAALPAAVDLRPKCPPVYDQGSLGSCTANALVGAVQFDAPSFLGSRLFLYYQERAADGDVGADGGSTLSRGVAVLEAGGVCAEALWPYDAANFAVAPPAAAVADAAAHRLLEAHHVPQTLEGMKGALAAGFPFVMGILVFASFESAAVAATGVVPMPAPGEACLGGHAVMCVGYDDAAAGGGGAWICRNSWSAGWGDAGYFHLPYAYMTDANLTSDLWALTKVAA